MFNPTNKTRPMSATHRAAEEIRQLIFTGELTADSNHLESELANRLGISRTPVREATLMLQASGLVEVQPRKGVRINALSAEDMQDIYLVLTEVECLAVRLAARQGYSKTDLRALETCIENMDDALEKENLDAWAIADETFHCQLIALSNNKRICAIVKTFNDQVRRVRSTTLKMRPLPVRSNLAHRALYEAILLGDEAKADSIHRQHREQVAKTLTHALKQSGLKRV